MRSPWSAALCCLVLQALLQPGRGEVEPPARLTRVDGHGDQRTEPRRNVGEASERPGLRVVLSDPFLRMFEILWSPCRSERVHQRQRGLLCGMPPDPSQLRLVRSRGSSVRSAQVRRSLHAQAAEVRPG